eukprot:354879-Chlamydomonas_euryale.AAC.11
MGSHCRHEVDSRRLETVCERCGTSLLELMVCRRTLQWTGTCCEWRGPPAAATCWLLMSMVTSRRQPRGTTDAETGSQENRRLF